MAALTVRRAAENAESALPVVRNVVTLDGSVLDGEALDSSSKTLLWGAVGSSIVAERSFDNGGAEPAPRNVASGVRFTRPNGPNKDLGPHVQKGKGAIHPYSHPVLTPPTVSGFSCAPRMELTLNGSYTRQKAPDQPKGQDDSSGSLTQQPPAGHQVRSIVMKGRVSLHQAPPRSPFRSHIEGMSVYKLGSLDTHYSQALAQCGDPPISIAAAPSILQLRARGSSDDGELSLKGADFVTVVGSFSGLPTSAGPWWSAADIVGLPQERSGLLSDDDQTSTSEFNW
eukprot:CAMPEP_0117682704 /NCGR_PEP_ID=MMETSP0804-20121206/19858_1 /TAXON_ID=1074897 /ORGANISM="Tetraselmis astigmatica, Strain CCMP880" /LENGTH=283 /DNA_ID=CAMNT_0005492947 /DNA_START=113 /DNA_END=961 /DNA_ORIENTATION=-